MSEIINWITKARGPESIIIYCDVYDYELGDAVYTEKEEVMMAIKNIFAEVNIEHIEDFVVSLKIEKDPLLEWVYDDFERDGVEEIKDQIVALIDTSWYKIWNFDGWYSDGSDHWQFNFRRHNFV